jgi:hypothetical protein
MLRASLLSPSLLCNVLICARKTAEVVQHRELAAAAAAAAIFGPLGKEDCEGHSTAQGGAAVLEPGSARQANSSGREGGGSLVRCSGADSCEFGCAMPMHIVQTPRIWHGVLCRQTLSSERQSCAEPKASTGECQGAIFLGWL